MADLCDEVHPEHPEVICDKSKPCYAYHQSQQHRMTWGERELPMSKTSNPMVLVNMARQIRSHRG
jgi:hypothetical protein